MLLDEVITERLRQVKYFVGYLDGKVNLKSN